MICKTCILKKLKEIMVGEKYSRRYFEHFHTFSLQNNQ